MLIIFNFIKSIEKRLLPDKLMPYGLFIIGIMFSLETFSKPPEFIIEIKDHLFIPSRIEIPENTKVKLIIYNRDSTSEEFESYELNREKIIMGNRKATIFIGPLKAGEYPFFGEFNPKLAQGVVVVVKNDNKNQETD